VRFVSWCTQDTLLSSRIEKLTGWRPIDGSLQLLPWGSGATDPWRVNPKAAFVLDRLVLFLSRSATLIILRTTCAPLYLFTSLSLSVSFSLSLYISVSLSFSYSCSPPSRSSGLFAVASRCSELFDIRRTSTIYPLRRANKITLILPQHGVKR